MGDVQELPLEMFTHKKRIGLQSVANERMIMCNLSKTQLEHMKWVQEINVENVPQIIKQSRLWWVNDEMTNLIDVASKSYPSHKLVIEDFIEDMFGICFFERPLTGINTEDDSTESVTIHAMSWSPGLIANTSDGKFTVPALFINSWSRADDDCIVAQRGFKWISNGHACWILGEQQGVTLEEQSPISVESAIEDCSRLMTIFMLASQKGVAELSEYEFGRPERRRAQRSNANISPIKVINLRKQKSPLHSELDPREVNWSHRWIVDGHWRNQPYGPGRNQTRPVWIAPHVKGPEDKPLVVKDAVKVLTA
jgi:hypothetical protein